MIDGASFGPGSREPSPAVSALAGFDPSRAAELHENELLILRALHAAYELGRMHYADFSAAYDATVARAAALSWLVPRDSDRSPEGEDA